MKEHFRAFTKTGRELNSAFQWHHDALFIGFVEKGSADVQLPGEKLSIDEGEGFFVNQGAFFSVTSPDETDGCILHAILFSPEDISAPTEPFYETYLSPLIKNNMQKGTALHLDTPWQKEVLRLTEQVFEKLSEEQKKKKAPLPRRLSALESDESALLQALRDTLCQAIFLLYSNGQGTQAPASAREARDNDHMKTMLRFIDENFHDEIDADSIADSAGVSAAEAIRCFHTMLNTTPIQYLKSYRIRQAAYFLRTTDDRIVDVAVRCGFLDISYFAKAFRLARGASPTDYRMQFRNNS